MGVRCPGRHFELTPSTLPAHLCAAHTFSRILSGVRSVTLLSPWRTALLPTVVSLTESVYSALAGDKYIETLLRLRANTMIPSTFAFVDERHYKMAAARGLSEFRLSQRCLCCPSVDSTTCPAVLGNHHVMPVGLNTYVSLRIDFQVSKEFSLSLSSAGVPDRRPVHLPPQPRAAQVCLECPHQLGAECTGP